MNYEMINEDYYSVKSLLQEWKLSHLFPHFIAQNINVDILKIMKMNHATELLGNFTLGERIRFEYEFDKWRRSIGCPLNNKSDSNTISNQSTAMPMSFIPNVRGNVNGRLFNSGSKSQVCKQLQSISTQTNIDTPIIDLSDDPPVSILKTSNCNPKNISTQTSLESPGGAASNEHSPRISRSNISCPAIVLNQISTTSIPPSPQKESRRGRPVSTSIGKIPSSINARAILEQCKPRGPELMQIYKINKTFRPAERLELINMFANYFHCNGIHLPVNLCYDLEEQILKLFPGERLKDYRTEKRGKIYIRLSNNKSKGRSIKIGRKSGSYNELLKYGKRRHSEAHTKNSELHYNDDSNAYESS